MTEPAAEIMDISGTGSVVCGNPGSGDVRDSLADISRAAGAFRVRADYTVKSGFRETIGWYMSRGLSRG